MPLEPWVPQGESEETEHGIFRLRSYLARSPRTGDSRRFTVIDTSDWVNVVATTVDDEFVLVRQYRHGKGDFTLEVAGGIIDPGEPPVDAAVRELREETGFEGEVPVPLGVVDPNPAIISNRCHTFWIGGCRRSAAVSLDPGEDIEVMTVAGPDVRAAVVDGRIAHALVLCALHWYRDRSPDGAPAW